MLRERQIDARRSARRKRRRLRFALPAAIRLPALRPRRGPLGKRRPRGFCRARKRGLEPPRGGRLARRRRRRRRGRRRGHRRRASRPSAGDSRAAARFRRGPAPPRRRRRRRAPASGPMGPPRRRLRRRRRAGAALEAQVDADGPSGQAVVLRPRRHGGRLRGVLDLVRGAGVEGARPRSMGNALRRLADESSPRLPPPRRRERARASRRARRRRRGVAAGAAAAAARGGHRGCVGVGQDDAGARFGGARFGDVRPRGGALLQEKLGAGVRAPRPRVRGAGAR
ncbi:hypothetical protein M885DRAFT_528920 [Pelagophyceae sp. CCMP2097]|nr:hypothetical protein M885DRAFT_528920 [Pelagophyceae sp. CCMP2097]